MNSKETSNVKNDWVLYRYGMKGGLRYYLKNYSEYLKEFGDIGYIDMDIDNEYQITFLDFIERCAPLNENQWTQRNFSVINYNSQTFTIKALEILKPNFSSSYIQLRNSVNPKEKKINILPNGIREVLISNQNKTDNLDKINNEKKDEEYKNKYII